MNGVGRSVMWVYERRCQECVGVRSRMCQRMYGRVNACAVHSLQVPLSVLSPIAANGIIRVSNSVHP